MYFFGGAGKRQSKNSCDCFVFLGNMAKFLTNEHFEKTGLLPATLSHAEVR